MLEKILRKIEKMREYPEPIRRQLLWVFVASFSLFIGIIWAATLGWQMHNVQPKSASSEANSVNNKSTLPGLRESIRNDISSAKGASKNALREFLLKDSQQQKESDTIQGGAAQEESSSATKEPAQLPKE